ncbi:hypothetical protein NVP1198B_63 [Vibrio phage 1.198.B._10N.286.54.F4]|nr:hypothetical protein NVP1198A_64 [Vibrio phage 1.198.A._10N.286.54.F4]AUR94851.1 hypothetical protein NVP1198B_63 [Vibrio phage 1.198.B._10N.286.54.F4]
MIAPSTVLHESDLPLIIVESSGIERLRKMITTQQNSMGLWFLHLDGDVLTGGWLTEAEAINEMEQYK